MAGPTMKPSPKAAPIIPYARARSSGAVMSATYARAVEMLPPESPSMMRATNSIARLLRQRQHHEADDRAGEAENEHRTPAVAIRQVAENRRRKELAEREHREQQADGERRRAERLRVERQQRNDDAEADEVDEDREEDDQERTRHLGRTLAGPRTLVVAGRRRGRDWPAAARFRTRAGHAGHLVELDLRHLVGVRVVVGDGARS